MSSPEISNPCMGLLAGSGSYPLRIAEGLRRRGVRVCALGVIGEADPALIEKCDVFEWVKPTRLGTAIRFFQKHHVTRATMGGKILLQRYFSHGLWLRNLPDWRLLRVAIPFFVTRVRDCRCDSILSVLCAEFAKDGIQFVPATDDLPELLVKVGTLTQRVPSESEWKDLYFGWKVAKILGHIDIGQSVLVRNQTVVAVEAMEHTDQTIERAGQICKSGGFVLIKTAKPSQDMRFDVPTIGLGTLETLARCGGRAIAVEAEHTLLVEMNEGEFIAKANQLGIAVVAVNDAMMAKENP